MQLKIASEAMEFVRKKGPATSQQHRELAGLLKTAGGSLTWTWTLEVCVSVSFLLGFAELEHLTKGFLKALVQFLI